MSILQDAHEVVINGGDFRNVQNLNICQHGSTGIDIIREASTPEASVDAEERSYAPSCYPGTRDQYIDDINNWAMVGSNHNTQPIYWMKGPAGVGKSAIAQTCAARLKDAGQLGAAFFFSIDGRRKDHTRFFPTLAYQLSTIYQDYRELVNRKVSVDPTLVKKTMTSQFKSLIVEPLQELKEHGKGLKKRAIFIDGLDECESQNAQVEIIQIIASSVQNGSTPFRWAIFSREEPHIVSTFADPNISSHCYPVLLPISRKADEEVRLYLRGGFKNILQRRNLLGLVSSWPAEEDIQKLVNAASGLFAHPATVLRFIDQHSYSGFKESLEAVLTSIATHSTKTTSLYVELDKLYTLILQRVPQDILPTLLILLSSLTRYGFDNESWRIAPICNRLGISEILFQSIFHHLQAVLTVQDPPQFTTGKAVALERSCYDQYSIGKIRTSLEDRLFEVHGRVNFRHKSFYDYLTDPVRSSTFCVTTPAARKRLFDRHIQQHFHYAPSYAIQGSSMDFLDCIDLDADYSNSELILAPAIANSSASLPWPQGSEFVDSYLKLRSFITVSCRLSHDHSYFGRFLQDIPLSSLHQLAELDYRKYMLADKMVDGNRLLTRANVVGYVEAGISRHTDDSVFMCIPKDTYDVFDPAVFLRMVEKLEELRVIRPYNPHLGSSRAASFLRTFSRQKPHGRRFGQYKLGHGDKSVIWYWEFDPEERYFHEFQTINFTKAMAYYKAEKFKIWEETDGDFITDSDEGDDTGDSEDDTEDEGDDGGDSEDDTEDEDDIGDGEDGVGTKEDDIVPDKDDETGDKEKDEAQNGDDSMARGKQNDQATSE